jgi:DNA ligase 1
VNSDDIFEAIEAIAATPSKNEKVQRIAKLLQSSDQARDILKLSYDPMVTFGIGEKSLPRLPIEHVVDDWGRPFNEDTFTLLGRLAKRQVTGSAATTWVHDELHRLSAKSAELLKRILLKDLRAGFTSSSINKAEPGTIITFDCALAHPFEDHKHKLTYPLVAEPKLDGVRVLAFVDAGEGEVHFFSRSGKEFTTFEHLKAPLLEAVEAYRGELMDRAGEAYDAAGGPEGGPSGDGIDCGLIDGCYDEHKVDEILTCVFDGEVVSGSFNKTVSEVRKKDVQATDAQFYAFDMLTRCEFDSPGPKDECGPSYMSRRKRLEELLTDATGKVGRGPIRLIPKWDVANEEQIHALYTEVRAKKLEGLIVKDPHAPYYRKRHHAFAKIKGEMTVDVVVVDAIEGTGRFEGMLGALVVDFGGVRVNVGTGFDEAQRASFYEAWQNDLNCRNDWIKGAPSLDSFRGELLGRLIEVEAHEVTPDGSLRHPRFVRFRDDKPLEKAA